MTDNISSYNQNDLERISFLNSINILDTPIEEPFERLCRLLRRALDMPFSGISIVDSHRNWFKCLQGISINELAWDDFFCATTMTNQDTLVVNRASQDERFRHFSLVKNYPNLEFYAGHPIIFGPNMSVGAIFVADTKTRELNKDDCDFLKDLAETAVNEIKNRFVTSVFDNSN
jgi:diguanylate cyclase